MEKGRTKNNRKTAFVLAAILATMATVVSWIAFAFLPLSPERLTFASSCFVVGVVCSLALYFVVTKLPDKLWVRLTASLLFVLCASIPILSAVVPRITYSRFGFTMYGVTPVPFLDITINRYGFLWFRPKTHQITREELEALISPGVGIVVVGIGWDSVAQLTDEAKLLGNSVDLRVLPTPEAYALYNKLKSEGRKVVLLAHSTC
jgi:hypothetical protein